MAAVVRIVQLRSATEEAEAAEHLLSTELRGWFCAREAEPEVEMNGSYNLDRRKSANENSSLLGFSFMLWCCLCCCGGGGGWGFRWGSLASALWSPWASSALQ